MENSQWFGLFIRYISNEQKRPKPPLLVLINYNDGKKNQICSTFSNTNTLSASMDSSNTTEDWEISYTWSTMYFGDDEFLENPIKGNSLFKCPKTWGHVKGACETCKNGCFHGRGRTDVHLKAH